MKYFLGAIILLSLGCRQNSNKEANADKRDDTPKVTSITKEDTASEYIDWNKVKLNGTIAMLSNIENTREQIGKPDSIITPKYEDVSASFFNGNTFKYVYYKGLEFETENDSLAFSRVDFSKNPDLYLTTDKIKLSSTTSLDEFKKLFPKSVKDQLPARASDTYATFRLNVAKGNTDDAWVLEFDTITGKLLNVEYFIPD